MRLDKFLAHASGASRKDVKAWIKAQRVTVNGATVRDAGMQLDANAAVCLDNELQNVLGLQYIMMNKPAGTVSTAKHADSRSVLSLLPHELQRDLHVVGRLDLDTTGLLLLSNDGQWSHRITAPASHCLKVYRVHLSDPFTASMREQLNAGVQLHDESMLLQARALVQHSDCVVDLTIGEGRYHQVKRMFAAVGNHVDALQRLQIGQLILDPSLEAGQWRELTAQEMELVLL